MRELSAMAIICDWSVTIVYFDYIFFHVTVQQLGKDAHLHHFLVVERENNYFVLVVLVYVK